MAVVGGNLPEEFVLKFFGNKPKIQQWMKNYNLFEIIEIDSKASGVFDSGEKWQFVVIKPVLVGGIKEEDFSYEDVDEDGNPITISTITIENFLLEVDE